MLSLGQIQRYHARLERVGKRTHLWGDYPNEDTAPCGRAIQVGVRVTAHTDRVTCKRCLAAIERKRSKADGTQ